ncbi:MAG TPA: hypothetical protein VFG51_02000 [Candidatus Saccharimonadia bacterium]|nr:hypothetical protein [Candidatus Saccharimonadia bacterium]
MRILNFARLYHQKKGVIGIAALAVVSLLLLALFMKGKPLAGAGSPLDYQYNNNGSVTGPFESSNSASRYMLAMAIFREHSFNLTQDEARFAAPDLVYHDGKFQSIFTPGVAFVAFPFLAVGSSLHIPQLSAFFSTILFALANMVLVFLLARKLGSSFRAAALSAFVFLFGTNALVYALSLTQHHASITVLLLGCLIGLEPKLSWKNCIAFGVLCGVGLLFDYPNLFLLFPIGLFMLSKAISLRSEHQKLNISFQPQILAIAIGLIPLLMVYGWYNKQTAGSPLAIGQFMGRTNFFDTAEKKAADAKATAEGARDVFAPRLPFQTRIQMEGMSVLALGNERSWLFYSPVLWIGALGLWALLRKQETANAGKLLLTIVVINFLIYSMFGDPWGGWSFGSRYLLPAASLMSTLIGVGLTQYRNKKLWAIFAVLSIYSILITNLGAITSAAIPPKQEALVQVFHTSYTYLYNVNLIHQNTLGPLFYNAVLHDRLNGWEYYGLTSAATLIVWFVLFSFLMRESVSRPIRRRKKSK